MTKPVPQAVFQPAEGQPRQNCGGPSLLELMWSTLLEELGQLMPSGDYHEDEEVAAGAEWYEERARIQGACQGISACIALVTNPYFPNVDDIKVEAITRWTAQQAAAGAGSEEA